MAMKGKVIPNATEQRAKALFRADPPAWIFDMTLTCSLYLEGLPGGPAAQYFSLHHPCREESQGTGPILWLSTES